MCASSPIILTNITCYLLWPSRNCGNMKHVGKNIFNLNCGYWLCVVLIAVIWWHFPVQLLIDLYLWYFLLESGLNFINGYYSFFSPDKCMCSLSRCEDLQSVCIIIAESYMVPWQYTSNTDNFFWWILQSL